MSELKPCPFCGGDKLCVHYSGIIGAETADDGWNVSCRYPQCHGNIFTLGFHEFPTREEAIAAWNTRVKPDAPAHAGETLSGDGKGCESTALEATSPAPATEQPGIRLAHLTAEECGETAEEILARTVRNCKILGITPLNPLGGNEQPDECPACGGRGWIEGVQAACCGNLTSGGECRGDCAVPEQTQEQCNICGGSGTAPKRESCALTEEWRVQAVEGMANAIAMHDVPGEAADAAFAELLKRFEIRRKASDE